MKYTAALRIGPKEYYAELDEGKEITFGSHKKDDIKVAGHADHLLKLKVRDSGAACTYRKDGRTTEFDLKFESIKGIDRENGVYIYVSRLSGTCSEELVLPYSGRITAGRSKDRDIMLTSGIVSGRHFEITCESGRIHVRDTGSTNGLYLNGNKLENALLKAGDTLSIYTVRIRLLGGKLVFMNVGSSIKISDRLRDAFRPFENEEVAYDKDPKYLEYHLSPRVREQLPHEDLVLSSPPAAAQGMGGKRGNWAYLIGSGAMMAASLASGMVSPAMMMMRMAAMASPVANIAVFSKLSKEEQKQLEEFEALRQETYRTYIDDQKARIGKVADIQRRIIKNENPEPADCLETVNRLKTRLWERLPSDSDFLDTRLGTGRQKLCVAVKSRADVDGFQMDDDELERLTEQIIEETRYVDDIPVILSFADFQTIGMTGSKAELFYQLRSIIAEITVQHSSKDVRLVCFFDNDWKGQWGFLRWLPHIWDESGQVRYLAFDESSRTAVSEMLSDLIGQRRAEAQAEGSYKKTGRSLPHYVILVQNRELISGSDIYGSLTSNDPSLGITTVFMADSLYNIPQACQYMIELEGGMQAYDKDKYDERSVFKQDPVLHQKEMNAFARKMSAIELDDMSGVQEMPSAVTFLEGYGVENVAELDIEERWMQSKPQDRLAAPIGMMTGGRTFDLDIASSEKAHGPHGLLAGTTGSGKSELLQSWILSMAVNYHPHDVNFVIIDYKGGGMSDLMEPLPHVVGKITNISRNILRSLISLKSELKRRQRLFAKYGVNSISKYQSGYRDGIIKERLPHLIIVTDEFAELKKEEPEFLAELNSIATIGRSLGIHMLLATQRPAGVVTDQINSNSRFRICMKVQDVTDSREMLKRSDAAKITQPGRAYIRVGEDEIFELFQSFYSGAEYRGGHTALQISSNRVRIVGMTGERIDPLDHKRDRKSGVDELTAVTEHILDVCDRLGIEKLAGPWLPELRTDIPFRDIDVDAVIYREYWNYSTADLAVPVGQYDLPALQKQGVQLLDLEAEGHFGIFGIPSSGKSTLLGTVMLSLGIKNSPENVRITVIDAGSWNLKDFAGLPHVSSVILNRDEEKMKQFILSMRRELESRRQAFVSCSASSLSAYNACADKKLPAVVIVVSHVEMLFEQYVEMEYLLTDIAASGAAYGIHLVFTSNSVTGIRYKFLQLIKGVVALQMPEKGDYMSLVGRMDDVPEPRTAGRAVIKGNPPISFQTATLTGDGEGQDLKEAADRLMSEMRDTWEHMKPALAADGSDAGTAAVPEAANVIMIGRDAENGTMQYLTLDQPYQLLISGGDSGVCSSALGRIRHAVQGRGDIELIEMTDDSWDSFPDELVAELNRRKKALDEAKLNGNYENGNWKDALDYICIMIDDLPTFSAKLDEKDRRGLLRIFTKATDLGLMVICSGCISDMSGDNDVLTAMMAESADMLVFGGTVGGHEALRNRVDPVYWGMEIGRDEAAVLDGDSLSIVRFW